MVSSSSNNSKNNSNNNSSQQQQIQNVNQYQNFFPGYQIQQEIFGKTLMPPVKEHVNGKTQIVRKPWPYVRSVKERVYDNFISKVVDPVTGKYYPSRDDNGAPIPMPDNGPNCRYIINSIVRIRLSDGSNKLYSYGQ